MRGPRVLFIDGGAGGATPVAALLDGEPDFEVDSCAHPSQALAHAVDVAPTIIVLDLGDPVVETIRALREDPRIRDVPLVVIAAVGDPDAKARAFDAGASDYVVGPVERRELIARLRYHSACYRRVQERNQAYAYVRQTFGRYVSDPVVSRLLETGGLALGGERRPVTILMADLRGFSRLTETLPPEKVVALLNNYLGEMSRVIMRHGGTIDEFVGDAILAIFGAPTRHADDARRAVACALEMQRQVPRVDALNAAAGLPPIALGIGLDTGDVVAGNIGSSTRAKYGVVGAHVNTAARIEAHTVAGQVLVSAATRAAIGADLVIDDELEIALKGSATVVTAYSVRGLGRDVLPTIAPVGPLDAPLPARFSVGVSGDGHPARVIRLTQTEAEVLADTPPPPGAWIRLVVLDDSGDARWAGVRAQVLPRPVAGGFAARLSPVSMDVIAYVRRR